MQNTYKQTTKNLKLRQWGWYRETERKDSRKQHKIKIKHRLKKQHQNGLNIADKTTIIMKKWGPFLKGLAAQHVWLKITASLDLPVTLKIFFLWCHPTRCFDCSIWELRRRGCFVWLAPWLTPFRILPSSRTYLFKHDGKHKLEIVIHRPVLFCMLINTFI